MTRTLPRAATALAALAAAAVTVLAGCAAPETAPAAPAAAGAFPVTIPHAFGETTIEAAPQRVVAVGFNEADFVLALGVVPVGVRDFFGEFDEAARPWAQEALGGARPADVGGRELNLEQVAAQEPDLVLGVYSFLDQTEYDALTRIAPTVAQPNTTNDAATWQEQTRVTGRALGRSARAEQVITDVEARFAQVRAQYPALEGANVPVDLYVEGTHYLLGTDDNRSQVFDGLGVAVPADTTELSPETLFRLDGDALVVIGATAEQIAADPVLGALPVVAEGRTVYTGGYETEFAGAVGFNSPLSLPRAMDIVAPQLAEALGR